MSVQVPRTVMDLALNTINLHAMVDGGGVDGIASGCLIEVDAALLLLGVRHVTDNDKRWAIHIRAIPGDGSELWQMFGNRSYACPELHGVAQKRRRSRERT
jgi:hypothetical protein